MPHGLNIRPVERQDLVFLRDLANDPVVRENVVGWDWPLSLAGQELWFAKGIDTNTTRRFIIENGDGEPIGLTGLWNINWQNGTATMAVKLGGNKSVRGRGYGKRTVWTMMDFAFNDVGLRRLHSTILEFNQASLTTFIEKSGWKREGVARQHVWRNGEYWDVIHIAILRNEYKTWLTESENS